MTTRECEQHDATDPRESVRTPGWMRWAAYMMCGWSLLFAALHFVSAADWTPATNEDRRIEANPFAWFLCAGILCVIGTVAALALIQSRKQCFPRLFMLSSSLSGGALVIIYVSFSFLVNGFHWALAPGVLCVVGALVALALTQPWGQHLPRWLMLLFVWAGGVILTLHALYGYVVHGLAALGMLTWTQVQQLAGAPVTTISAEAVRELITASLLIWNPWFLLGGLLFLAVAWYASRKALGRVRASTIHASHNWFY